MQQARTMYQTALPDPQLDPQFYERVPAKRLAAWVFDVVISLAMGAAVTLVIGILTFGFGLVLFLPILFMTGLIYRTLTIASGSATWGMRFVGIELRGHDGHRFGGFQAGLHSLIFMFLMASVIGTVFHAFAILTTERGQGLPDLILGSTAINRPA